MPKGKQVAKDMVCKQCGATIRGKPHDMARHVRLGCKGKAGPVGGAPKGTGMADIDPVALIDSLDPAALHAEIERIDRRRAALGVLLDAAKARHKTTAGHTGHTGNP